MREFKSSSSYKHHLPHPAYEPLRALYTWNSLQHFVDSIDSDENFKLEEYWHKVMITACLSVTHVALKDMKKKLSSHTGRGWPECIQDYESFLLENIQHKAVNNAIKLTKVLSGEGFDITDEVNINQCPT